MENKIEYKVCDKFSGNSDGLEEHLNNHGVDGWEVVSIVDRGRNADFPKNNDFRIVFKRPLTQQAEQARETKKSFLQRLGLNK